MVLKAQFALLLVTFIWGWTFPVVKAALHDATPLALNSARFLVAILVIACVAGKGFRKWPLRGWIAGGIIGLFMFLGYTLQTFGLLTTTPSRSAFITGLSVIMVPISGGLLLKRFPPCGIMWGAVLALGGTWLLYHPLDLNCKIGDFLTLLCAVAYAGQILAVERFAGKFPFQQLVLAQVGVPLVLTALFCAMTAKVPMGIEAPRLLLTAPVAAALAVSGIGGTAAAFLLQNWAQQYASASHTAVIFAMEAVFAAVCSYWLVGERLSPLGILGGGLIVLGTVVASITPVAPPLRAGENRKGSEKNGELQTIVNQEKTW